MKKLLLPLFIILSCAVFLAGCSGGDSGGSASGGSGGGEGKKLKVGIVFDKGGRGDKSFNDSAWRGIEKAVAELGIEQASIESKSDSEFDGNLTAMADQGCDLIFGIGYAMKDSITSVAKNYPDIKFALVDDVAAGDNVRSLTFKEEEGSFLVGYLAGLMTKSNKVGFVGGMQSDLITKFYAGYVAGVKTANPACEVLPAKYTGNWDNVDTGKVAANVLYGGGADVIYHAAGKAGLGVLTAAKDSGKFAIGVDSDQDDIAEGHVLTSMIKRVDTAVFKTIEDLKNGKFTNGQMAFALADGGVGVSEMRFTKDIIGQTNLDKLNAVSDQIKAGEVKVPATEKDLAAYVSGLK